MKVELLDGISGTYEDGITPLYAGPGDVIDVSAEWAQRLIEAGIAKTPDVVEEPKKASKKVV